MIILLDAHALLWWLDDDPRLSSPARRSLADPANDVLASSVSLWELEIKRVAGSLTAPDDIIATLEQADIAAVPLTGGDAIVAARLPPHHRDPFDRMVIAQAQRLEAVIVTRDRAFADYEVNVLTA